jgi:hypothetical protein
MEVVRPEAGQPGAQRTPDLNETRIPAATLGAVLAFRGDWLSGTKAGGFSAACRRSSVNSRDCSGITAWTFMPDRCLFAPLSPREEVTLRREPLGMANLSDLPAGDIERLKALVLVGQQGLGRGRGLELLARLQRKPKLSVKHEGKEPLHEKCCSGDFVRTERRLL